MTRMSWIRSLSLVLLGLGFSVAAGAGDLDALQARGTLRHLGIPYANFVTGAGDGLDVELIQDFARHLGLEYEYVKTDWGMLFGDLTGRAVKPNGAEAVIGDEMPVRGDVAANGITVLPWRQSAVDFSVPTFPNQVWLVARADSPIQPIVPTRDIATDIAAVRELIAGRSLLGKPGTCLDPALYNLDQVTGQIRLFSGSLNEVAPALLNGEAELTLLDVPDALVALQKWPGQIKILGPVSEQQDMAVAFAKDAPGLRAAFDAYLKARLQDGSYVALVGKYYPFVFDYFPEFFATK